MSLIGNREAYIEAACSETPPSSSASEDVIDLAESDISLPRIQDAVSSLLRGVGEDAGREGLRETPRRVAKAWLDATEGYRQSVHSVLGGALFHETFSSRRDNSLVLIQDVDVASTSEHNLLPFFGRCHIAYVPRNGVVLGLSKVARLAKMFARRLQNQQRLTDQLLEAFNAEVQPLGCAAVVQASQISAVNLSQQTTYSALGCFYEQPNVFMQEFATLLGITSLPPGLSICQSAGNHRQAAAACAHFPDAAVTISDCQQLLTQSNKSSLSPQAKAMVAAVEDIIREVGEDPSRQGLNGSSARYVEHLLASTSGIDQYTAVEPQNGNLLAHQLGPWPASAADELALSFTSQCEHHLLPFHGSIQVICLPGSSGTRLSLGRLQAVTHGFSKRLQIQERLTHQIADALHRGNAAAGTLVLCRAAHMCMVARGVEKHASSTVTIAAYGVFETNHALRGEALQRLRLKRSSAQ